MMTLNLKFICLVNFINASLVGFQNLLYFHLLFEITSLVLVGKRNA